MIFRQTVVLVMVFISFISCCFSLGLVAGRPVVIWHQTETTTEEPHTVDKHWCNGYLDQSIFAPLHKICPTSPPPSYEKNEMQGKPACGRHK